MKSVFRKKNEIRSLTFLLLIFWFNPVCSQKALVQDTIISPLSYRSKFEFGIEYLNPTRFSNKIETVSAHVLYWKQYFRNISVLISAGITGTYAWGYSRQYKVVSDTTYYWDHKTQGLGLGPVIQIDYAPIKIKRFSLIVEASGGFILYSNRFPYGGDFYNYMFRTGPSFCYQINNKYSFKLGYRWMHVSNGKGYGNQNPFYEAQGLNFSLIIVQ